jgi:hypothetical protein
VCGSRCVTGPEDGADSWVQLLTLAVELQLAAAVHHAPEQVIRERA